MRPFLPIAAAVLIVGSACANQNLPAGGAPTLPTSVPTSVSTSSQATPAARPSTTADAAATTPAASATVVYEVTGSGTALTIDYSPDAKGGSDRMESVPLPWTKTFPIVGIPSLFEVVIVGGDNVACTITVAGKVVAEQPVGGTSHCLFTP